MSEQQPNTVTAQHRSALHREGPGFAVTVLPASPYRVSYVPDRHVIGFTFERQRGVDAFGSARRRPFDAESRQRRFNCCPRSRPFDFPLTARAGAVDWVHSLVRPAPRAFFRPDR
jgi:hypothetical protein